MRVHVRGRVCTRTRAPVQLPSYQTFGRESEGLGSEKEACGEGGGAGADGAGADGAGADGADGVGAGSPDVACARGVYASPGVPRGGWPCQTSAPRTEPGATLEPLFTHGYRNFNTRQRNKIRSPVPWWRWPRGKCAVARVVSAAVPLA